MIKEFIVKVTDSVLPNGIHRFEEEYSPEQELVRCKDCKHRPTIPDGARSAFDIQFPDEVCPCSCEDGFYSWCPDDNWFCASGEK